MDPPVSESLQDRPERRCVLLRMGTFVPVGESFPQYSRVPTRAIWTDPLPSSQTSSSPECLRKNMTANGEYPRRILRLYGNEPVMHCPRVADARHNVAKAIPDEGLFGVLSTYNSEVMIKSRQNAQGPSPSLPCCSAAVSAASARMHLARQRLNVLRPPPEAS